MRNKAKWGLAVFLILVVAITTVLYIQSRPTRQAGLQGDNASQLLQFQVTKQDLSNAIEVRGKSSYEKETWIYAPFQAEVEAWHVQDGAEVAKGDVLFKLKEERLRNEIALVQANQLKQELDIKLRKLQQSVQEHGGRDPQAETTEHEALKLYAQKEEVKIQNQLDQINQNSAQAGLAEKQKQLQNAVFTSPEDGIFLFHEKKEPQIVENLAPLGKIVDLSKLQLISTVGEYEVFKIKEGMAVEVRVDAMKQINIKGNVERVSKFALSRSDQSTGAAQFEVIISLEQNEQLIAGLSLTGSVLIEQKQNAIVVPTIAVQRENEQYYVQLDTGAGIEKRIIEIGLETADKTEVLAGLVEGDTVVLQ